MLSLASLWHEVGEAEPVGFALFFPAPCCHPLAEAAHGAGRDIYYSRSNHSYKPPWRRQLIFLFIFKSLVLTVPSMPQPSIHVTTWWVIKRQTERIFQCCFLGKELSFSLYQMHFSKKLASHFWLLTFPTSTGVLSCSMHEWTEKKEHFRWTGNPHQELHICSIDLFESSTPFQSHIISAFPLIPFSHHVWINTAAITPAC